MPKKSQLDSLLRHADWQEQQAKAKWLKARQQTLLAENQLQDLRRYMDEYSQQPLAGVSAVTSLQHREAFSQRLSLAISEQAKKCRLLKFTEEDLSRLWLDAQTHQKALQEMKARRKASEKVAAEQREQRQLDDLSTRRGAAHA